MINREKKIPSEKDVVSSEIRSIKNPCEKGLALMESFSWKRRNVLQHKITSSSALRRAKISRLKHFNISKRGNRQKLSYEDELLLEVMILNYVENGYLIEPNLNQTNYKGIKSLRQQTF